MYFVDLEHISIIDCRRICTMVVLLPIFWYSTSQRVMMHLLLLSVLLQILLRMKCHRYMFLVPFLAYV